MKVARAHRSQMNYDQPMALLMRPGTTLLLAGVVSYVVSKFIGGLPLLGSILSAMLLLFSIFAVIGGVWLIVAERRAARV